MAFDITHYYKLLPGKWELECACGELQVYTFNSDLTYEALTFPKTWRSRIQAELAGRQCGTWYLKVEDKGSYSKEQLGVIRAALGEEWVNPEKVLWLKRGGESPGVKLEVGVGESLKILIESINSVVDAAFSAFDADSCGVAFVTFVDAETINIRMKSPCGGVLRRVPSDRRTKP